MAPEEEEQQGVDFDDDDFTLQRDISSTPTVPKHWKVELIREQQDEQQKQEEDVPSLLPIVEFMLDAGRISIRLSGKGVNKSESSTTMTTTLAYHASFQNPLQRE